MERSSIDTEDSRNDSSGEVVATLAENHRRFLDFLERRLGSRAAAEDVLQEAFVRGIERAGSVRESEAAVPWFFRVLRNAIVDHRRRAGAPLHAASDVDLERDLAGPDAETSAVLCQCILSLSDTLKSEYATALRRVEIEGVPVQTFAAEAGITPGNAAVRLSRAREALRKRLAASCRTCAEHGCLDCTCGGRGGSGPGAPKR